MATIQDVWIPANRILRAARQQVADALRPLNISSVEGNILLHLQLADGEVSQERLVAELDLDKGAVSRAVDMLSRKGLITRERGAPDLRRYRLRLTERAREIAPQVQSAYDGVYRRIADFVLPEHIDQVARLLTLIAQSLSAGPGQEVTGDA